MEEMCRAAVARGFREIGFSEHYDLNPVDDCFNWLEVDAWYAELERCRQQFVGKLVIRAGVEFSEPHLYPQGVQNLLDSLQLDYIIGSLHYVGTQLVFAEQYFRQRSVDQAFLDYFTELELMTRTGNFDILGHLDVLALTGKQVYGVYEPARYEDVIRAALRNCVERGNVIEINTQGLRKPVNMLVPGMDILRWYVEMGGESVCPGSDAHQTDQVGAHLDAAIQSARQAGIQSITGFEKRQKRILALPEPD